MPASLRKSQTRFADRATDTQADKWEPRGRPGHRPRPDAPPPLGSGAWETADRLVGKASPRDSDKHGGHREPRSESRDVCAATLRHDDMTTGDISADRLWPEAGAPSPRSTLHPEDAAEMPLTSPGLLARSATPGNARRGSLAAATRAPHASHAPGRSLHGLRLYGARCLA